VVGYQEHGIVYPSFILVKGRKTFWLAEQLLSSLKRLCFMDLPS
jgi:hypothetical protein